MLPGLWPSRPDSRNDDFLSRDKENELTSPLIQETATHPDRRVAGSRSASTARDCYVATISSCGYAARTSMRPTTPRYSAHPTRLPVGLVARQDGSSYAGAGDLWSADIPRARSICQSRCDAAAALRTADLSRSVSRYDDGQE